VIAVGQELHEAGLVAGTAGNLSARLAADRMLITAAGSHLGRLEASSLVEVSVSEGTDSPAHASSELPFHRAAYEADRGVEAVVHTHGPALVAAGLRGLDITKALPEVALGTGPMVTLPPAESGSTELARAVRDAVAAGGGVLLLRGHGAVAVGRTVRKAADRMELAELSAYAVLLGAGEGDAVVRTRVERLARRLTERLKGSS
jgi:ribulose-5-phosphate 4-epimerase/fuculose-1-phosphate aldolase